MSRDSIKRATGLPILYSDFTFFREERFLFYATYSHKCHCDLHDGRLIMESLQNEDSVRVAGDMFISWLLPKHDKYKNRKSMQQCQPR